MDRLPWRDHVYKILFMSMNEVKSAKRVFEILRYFAATRVPASLSQIATALGYPKSSCLALLETLESEGYAYQVVGGYYLTRRWLNEASIVAEHDYLVLGVRPMLERLCDELNETVILAQLAVDKVVYLDVVEPDRILRFSARPGQFKPLHASASGRALLGIMAAPERLALIRQLKLTAHTPHTPTGIRPLQQQIEEGIARGWQVNLGEYQADTLSVAAPLIMHGAHLALVVGAPMSRALNQTDLIGSTLAHAAQALASPPSA